MRFQADHRTLIIGIGNSSRGDDGLGWSFLDQLDTNFEKVYRYQLQVEDADLIAEYDRVVFVDASESLHPEGILLKRAQSGKDFSYSTHQLSPESVIFLCRDLYGAEPETWTLEISGYQWELGEELSDRAKKGLEKALELFQKEFAIQHETGERLLQN